MPLLPRRSVAFGATSLALLLFVRPGMATAQQCAGDIRSEVLALEAVADSLVKIGFPKNAADDANAAGGGNNGPDNSTPQSRVRDALTKDGVYLASLANAGTAAGCLFDQRALYRSTFEAAIGDKTSTLTEDDVKRAARLAASAVLGTRYSSTDRVGVLFGFGMTVTNGDDRRRFKVVQRNVPPAADAPAGTQPTQENIIVEESDSRLLPAALTGIAVRFRDRDDAIRRSLDRSVRGARSGAASFAAWTVDHLLPTTVFGSVQLGTSENGPVTGTALGFGWRIVGDVTMLAGFSVTRVSTLRRDVLAEYDKTDGGRLVLPVGESESTIMGGKSAEAFMLALGVPISLQSVFGGKK